MSELNKWCYEDKGVYLAVSLAGNARSVPAYEHWSNVIMSRYVKHSLPSGEENQTAIATMQLKHRLREQGEPLPKYAGEVERLFRLAYPSDD